MSTTMTEPAATKAKRSGRAPVKTRRRRAERTAVPADELGRLAAEINEEHRLAEAGTKRSEDANRDSVAHAIVGGEKLNSAKERVGHGNWLTWVDEKFDGSRRTAQLYMRLAGRKEDAEALAHLGIERVASVLAKPGKPKVVPNDDWTARRGALLREAVRNLLDVSAVIDQAIGLAPEVDRERMEGERDAMDSEVRKFLARRWPVTIDPAPTLFAPDVA